MDKQRVLSGLRAQLAEQLEDLRAAAAAAREGATHEEAKPENEYDTRGLEQSYLAGAQTARVEALASALAWLEDYRPPVLSDDDPVQVGACVIVDDGEGERAYFICGSGGGTKVDVDGVRWWVLTPQSPLGRLLIKKRVGDVVEHIVRGEGVELEITRVG